MNWSKLSSQQLGRYAEYYAMMEFSSHGCDVYSSEVDDHGVDFVVKINNKFYEVQVKSMFKSSYVYMLKTKMDKHDDSRLVCLLRFVENELPNAYIIPALAWQEPNEILVDRNYENTSKSKPEFGIQFSQKNKNLFNEHTAEEFFKDMIHH